MTRLIGIIQSIRFGIARVLHILHLLFGPGIHGKAFYFGDMGAHLPMYARAIHAYEYA